MNARMATASWMAVPASGGFSLALCLGMIATSFGVPPSPVWYRDKDRDGFGDQNDWLRGDIQPQGYVANAKDCDDADPQRYPGHGCTTPWYRDADGDGFGDRKDPLGAEHKPPGHVDNAQDCDDADPDEYPGAVWYRDLDGDGFGDPDSARIACERPAGYVVDNTDCDDDDPCTFPGAWERCNGRDNDCDGYVPSDEVDADGDNYMLCDGDCDDGDARKTPGRGCPRLWYRDRDGDGYGDPADWAKAVDEPFGYVENPDDCNDTDPDAHPYAVWYRDEDGDGYGDPNRPRASCEPPAGYVADDTDCNDADPDTHPSAAETCDGTDNDCDGQVPADERDDDNDGVRVCQGDCDDTDALIHPGADEICDGRDNDCDTEVDEDYCTLTVIPDPEVSTPLPPRACRFGERVLIHAPDPPDGMAFQRWTGDVPEGCEYDDPLELVMDGDKTVTAAFITENRPGPCGTGIPLAMAALAGWWIAAMCRRPR